MGTASLALKKAAPVSASVADDMTTFIKLLRLWTAPLLGGGGASACGAAGGFAGVALRK